MRESKYKQNNFPRPQKVTEERRILTFNWGDLYHWLLNISWLLFLALIVLAYLAINCLFALAYLIGSNNIENAQPGSFLDAFSFSVQTMATIGYGAMYPSNLYAHILVTIEVFVGLMAVAMSTGLMFARFSRPTARIIFSSVAVICPYNGIPTLMFRTANQRGNFIVEAQVRVTLMYSQISEEGHFFRRLYDLQLVRSETPTFSLTWTVMHPIDETSPLHGSLDQILSQGDTRLVVTLTGLDETVAQTVHAHRYYYPEEIFPDHSFVDILIPHKSGKNYIDYRHFNDVKPCLVKGKNFVQNPGES